MGIEERAEEAISAEWTWRRMETKCEESFSPASGERRGAQRLERHVRYLDAMLNMSGEGSLRLAVADIPLHSFY